MITGFTRSFAQRIPNGERREYLKPMLFSGGVDQLDDRHLHKGQPEKDMVVAHSGQYPAETVFFRQSLPVIDIRISDLHNGGALNAYGMCFLQQSNLNMFTILQTQNRSTQ